MSRVITFSRVFPAHHPRKAEQTYFIEKIWQSLFSLGLSYGTNGYGELSRELENFSNPNHFIEPKHHTIRSRHRWKSGMKFSPRVWSGKPYQSKQIVIAPDIEIVKVWPVRIEIGNLFEVIIPTKSPKVERVISIPEIAKNDGLSAEDFMAWFDVYSGTKYKVFDGQIICWSPDIEY